MDNNIKITYDAREFNTENNPSFVKFFHIFVRKQGYTKDLDQLAPDILAPLVPAAMACWLAQDLQPGDIFKVIYPYGIELVFIKESKYNLLVEKESLVESLDLNLDDAEVEALLDPDNATQLKHYEVFTHPLSETKETVIDGKPEVLMNGYAIASTLINIFRGVGLDFTLQLDPSNKAIAIENAKLVITKYCLAANPILNIGYLLDQVLAGYVSHIVQLCTYINDGLIKLEETSIT